MKNTKCPYEIIYEDNEILVVYKKKDVFTIRTNDKKTFTHNLYHYLRLYLERKGENIYIVHRLDYETSGLIIFAKSGKIKEKLQQCFKNHQVLREYECIVKENLEINKSFHVEQYLSNIDGKVEIVSSEKEGKLAISDIKCTNHTLIGSVCKVNITTGKKNQIRIALASLGLTLLGDKRYSHNENKRMYLNAYHLRFDESLNLRKNDFYVDPLWIHDEL